VRGKGEREFLCETARARARESAREMRERTNKKHTKIGLHVKQYSILIPNTVASCNFFSNNRAPDGRMFCVNFSYSSSYFC
jgi:hypothetical protein